MIMSYQHIQVPESGEKITFKNGVIQVPDIQSLPILRVMVLVRTFLR